MRKLLIGMAAFALVATGAWAQGKDKAANDTMKSDTMTSDALKSSEVSGHLTKLDKDGKSVTIATPSGSEQTLKVASDAKITRDGSSIGLDQLKPGDNVRASFDVTSNEAKALEVTTKVDTAKPAEPKPMK